MFTPASSTNRNWNLTKTFAQTSLFWLTFLYLIPLGIVKIEVLLSFPSFTPFSRFGWIFFFIFSSIGLYSGYTMSWLGKGTPLPTDCPNKLVVKGPYKLVRNPMAVAGIGQGVCVGLLLGSYMVILYSIAGALLWHIIVRPIEEKDLELRFGNDYVEYKRTVKCWLPVF